MEIHQNQQIQKKKEKKEQKKIKKELKYTLKNRILQQKIIHSYPQLFLQPIKLYKIFNFFYLQDKNCYTNKTFDGLLTPLNLQLQILKFDLQDECMIIQTKYHLNNYNCQNINLLKDRLLSLNDKDAFDLANAVDSCIQVVSELKTHNIESEFATESEFNKESNCIVEGIIKTRPTVIIQGFINPSDISQQDIQITYNYQILKLLFKDIQNAIEYVMTVGLPGIFLNFNYFQLVKEYLTKRIQHKFSSKKDILTNSLQIQNQQSEKLEQFAINIRQLKIQQNEIIKFSKIIHFEKVIDFPQQEQQSQENSKQEVSNVTQGQIFEELSHFNSDKYLRKVQEFLKIFYTELSPLKNNKCLKRSLYQQIIPHQF